jgi:hypothetical protein
MGEDLISLKKKVIETVCMHEALFPESEALFPIHQIIDIVHHLEVFGPLKGSWTLFGERAISKIKAFVPQGGHAYNNTAFNGYLQFELNETQQYYTLDKGENHLYLTQNGKGARKFTYHPFPCSFYKADKKKRERILNMFDIQHIVECVLLDIETQYENERTVLLTAHCMLLSIIMKQIRLYILKQNIQL